MPTQIHARDYPRIRDFYEDKLKDFVRDAKIFDKYLNHLSTFEPRYKMMEWSKSGCESGPLFGLYSILNEIADDDLIWSNLFEICLKDKIDDKIIRNSISQQTVADFIALALKHHVKDVVKRRIKVREQKKQQQKSQNKEKSREKKRKQDSKNKDGLDKYILSESDRYILSIILPYFGSPALKSIHKSVGSESLTSGLFNHFCEKLAIEKREDSKPRNEGGADKENGNNNKQNDENDDVDDDIWCMKVPPLELKNKLLKHLHVEKYDVVKQYYVAVLQHKPARDQNEPTRWTFYIRPSTYSEIFNGKHKINMNAYTFMDHFEFREREVSGMQYINLIIKCVDDSFKCDWAMWTKKKLKLYTASLGYWKLLSTFDDTPRVPVDHLDCMLALLRHDAMSVSNKLLGDAKQYLSIVFLKEKNNNPLSMDDDNSQFAQEMANSNPYNKWKNEDIDAEYQLTFWNGKATGNSSLSLKLIKAHSAEIEKKKNLKSRESHFIHYRSKDEDIEWLWYDNDAARYTEYELGSSVPKQLEATYQGVSEDIFPIEKFKRETKSDAKERTFNCAQLPAMSSQMVALKHMRWKPFVLRFTFSKHQGKIINIEQLAINSYYDQFPRNVKRVYSGKSGVMINDEEQRVSSLGEMNIYQSDKSIIICWKFEQNHELGITKTYHYKVQIPMFQEIKFMRLLDCWRTNTLFDQTMSNRAMIIVQSRMWKTDAKMPPIKDITHYDDERERTRNNNDPYGHHNNSYHRNRNHHHDSNSDDDDDKDEEKQSKPHKKEEECIPCQMIKSNHDSDNLRKQKQQQQEADDSDNVDNGNGSQQPPGPSSIKRDRSQSTAQLTQITKYTHLYKSKAISDDDWILLDELDDEQRGTSNLIKQNAKYKDYDKDDRFSNVYPIWKQRHAPHKFRKELYKLVSLTFIQSIISVMKSHLKEKMEKIRQSMMKPSSPNDTLLNNKKPLIFVISDEQRLYDDIFSLKEEDYIATNSKSLSYLFDGKGEIKRIDSKRNIYSINIGDLQTQVLEKGYLHEFISMTSTKYKSTLVLFTRPNDSNNHLYISHNGYISKLSLDFNDEDLHYFLPLFIPLKIGDCVNIEAFSSPDYGTIVGLWRNEQKNNIIYRIRSTENVYYIMNYYKLVNRAQPKDYWYKTRKTVIKNEKVWDNVKLWKSQDTGIDPSDQSHPLHGIVLALVESSKQAIQSIESKLKQFAFSDRNDKTVDMKKLTIQHKLQNTGSIFLFYKTVFVEGKSEEVQQFEREEEEKGDDDDRNKRSTNYDSDNSDIDQNDVKESDPKGLSHLIKFLKRNKLICNVKEYDEPQKTTYQCFRKKAMEILEKNSSNRVFLCHMVETKKYEIEEVDNNQKEQAIDIAPEDDIFVDDDQEDDDKWLTFEPEEDDQPREKESEPQRRVVLKSQFECNIKYEFEMCSVDSPVLTVEDIMVMQNDKKNWTIEDHKLLTQFHNHNVWNKFDLLDKQLITKLKSQLLKNPNSNSDTNKLKLLEAKFTKFTEAVKPLLDKNKINDPLTQHVIAGVEVTRNAKLLQQYIQKFRRYNNNEDEKLFDYLDGDDAEIIESNNDRIMIVAYNPIQTVVVTSTMIKDVTHPIHLYRAAYDERFYPKDQIHQLNAEWMQTATKNANIINALSTLLRYNKKYEIILVPSSIHLDKENFLNKRCEMVAPEHESIADYRITFLYKGLLYRYDKKKAKKFKQQSLSIIKQQSMGGLDDLDDDDEKIFVDEIKFLLRLLHDNISEEQPDALDPKEAIFENNNSHRPGPSKTEADLDGILKTISQPSLSYNLSGSINQPNQRLINNSSQHGHGGGNNNHKHNTGISPKSVNRLRGSIKRKHTDRIFRWLNVGCGSCFLHESSGRAKEIGPKKGADYEKEFPKQLQKAMFLYYIDCRVPFNDAIITEEAQCAICKQLMIDPADIGNAECQHIFCKLCIQQWYFINYSGNENRMSEFGGGHNGLGNGHNNVPAHKNTCPLCRRDVKNIQVLQSRIPDMKKGIPTTIYQQIMEENQSRFLRQHLVAKYLEERERVLQAEQGDAPIGQLAQSDINYANQLAGYGNAR